MKTVKLKSTTHSFTLQNPAVPAGMDSTNDVHTYAITQVPDDMPSARVLSLASVTTFLSPFTRDFTYSLSELGHGRIAR